MPRPAGSLRSAGAALALLLVLGGCGSSRTPVLDLARPLPPVGIHPAFFPPAGLYFPVPSNWRTIAGKAPLVATVTSGEDVVAIWRYKRSEPLPRTRSELRQALTSLEGAARARDGTLHVISARTLRVGRAPAVQLVADETIGRQPRRVRSTHVFSHRAEIVFDAFAVRADFQRLDASVFAPMIAGAHVGKPRRP